MATFADNLLENILTNAFKRPDAPVVNSKAPEVAAIAVDVVKANPKVAVVEVKPAYKSKINILSTGVLVTVLGYFGINIPQTPTEWATFAVGTVYPLAVILFKTFFTPTVTPSSVK